MWVGLLFSIMSMSALIQQQDLGALGLSTSESRDIIDTYRSLTIQCLLSGDYLRPSRYTIETLCLHFTVDQYAKVDASIDKWNLIGVIIRLALRMGLHRDPSHWPNIRPLQAEFRRRLWIILYQVDFFTSTEVGLPRVIKDSQCDTRPPVHLFDNDIGLEHDEIPPERPMTEPTPLLYIIQRGAIIRVAAEIYDATEAGPPSSATSAALGAKLQSMIDAIPAWLRYRSPEPSIVENPILMQHRVFLDILINKSIYLLYRRSFLKGSTGEESSTSNERCIEASLEILEHQRRLSEETRPGGLMFGTRWKVASSLNQEFLQATMMLCFALNRSDDGHASGRNPQFLHRRDDIVGALTHAKSLWERKVDRSIDARKAVKVITSVLQQDSSKPGEHTLATTAFSDGEYDLHRCSYSLLTLVDT